MNRIEHEVRRAYRRLLFNHLLTNLTWAMFVALVLALIGVAIPKIWPLDVDGRTWTLSWIGGSLLAGLVGSVLWTFMRRRGVLDAAIEIDLRFGLKERVSSVMALSPEELSSAVGKALVDDAERRVKRIDIRDHFRMNWTWHTLLPLAAAILLFLVAFLPKNVPSDQAAASTTGNETRKQVRKSFEQLQKRLAERRKLTEKAELKDANAVLTKLQKAVDEMSKSDVDRKKAMIKLNNLSKELAARRKEKEASQTVRNQLRQLKNIERGPAERIANAMKAGDMKQALEELAKLSDKLRSDELTPEQKQQLIKQLQQLSKEINKMLAAKRDLEQKKSEIQEKIDQLKKKGDLAAAGQLQQQLDQIQKSLDVLEQQNPQIRQLEQLASQLSQSADSMKIGKGKDAADRLDELADSLKQMQSDLDNLKTMNELMDEIASAKASMNCRVCGGKGCEECQAAALGTNGMDMFSEQPGQGMGEGHGMGDRPEQETDTGGYRARVGAKPGKGEAIRMGDADGPNIAGDTRESISEEMASPLSEDPDPVTNQILPRRQRNQTKEYFELLRKGE